MKKSISPPFASVVVLILIFASATAAQCYFISGDVAVDDVPCSSNETTTCCNKKDICLSNGLCYLQRDNVPSISRGSCTDKFWQGSCASAKPCGRWNQNTGYRVVNAVNDTFCCGSVTSVVNGTPTCQRDNPFSVTPGTVIPGVAGLAAYTNGSSDGNNGTGSPYDERNDESTRLAIGLGLGIPLALVAGSALIWGGWERRQKVIAAKEARELKDKAGADNTMGIGMGMSQNHYGYGYGYAQGQPMQGHPTPLVELDRNTAPTAELDSGKLAN